MVGNVWEWTEDCWEGDCSRRVKCGGAWNAEAEYLPLRLGPRSRSRAVDPVNRDGFRVSRTLD